MSDSDTKPILLVKKSDSKKGSLWNTMTNNRIIKQHGGLDIPENDLHAIHKYESPINLPQTPPEEINSTLTDLEKEIKQLKEKDNQRTVPQQQKPDTHEQFNDEYIQSFTEQEDDLD